MVALDIIPTILDAIKYNPDNLLSKLKNKYNTAKNMSQKGNYNTFNPMKWVRGDNYNDIMFLIAFSLGLIQPSTIHVLDTMLLNDKSRRNSAHSYMVVILMLLSQNFDNEKSEWICEEKEQAIKICLAFQGALNDNFGVVMKDSATLYYTCQMIYDFFFCFLAHNSSPTDFTQYATNVFKALIRKPYYKKCVLVPFKEHYQKISKDLEREDSGFTKEGKYIIMAFTEERLDRIDRESSFSNHCFYYCKDETSLPVTLTELSEEELAIIDKLQSFFSTENNYKRFKKMVRNELSIYPQSLLEKLVKLMIERNYIVFTINKSKAELLEIIRRLYFAEEWIIKDNTRGSDGKESVDDYLDKTQKNDFQRFYRTVSMPTCLSELPNIEWIWINPSNPSDWIEDTKEAREIYANETTKKEALSGMIYRLWMHSVFSLTVNKDDPTLRQYHETECELKQKIQNHLKFYMQPKTAFEIVEHYSDYLDFNSIREIFLFDLLIISDYLAISIPDWKRNDNRLHWFNKILTDSFLQSAGMCPIDDFSKLWVLLKKPQPLGKIVSKCSKLPNGKDIEQEDMLNAICDLVEKEMCVIQTYVDIENNDLSMAYTILNSTLLDYIKNQTI